LKPYTLCLFFLAILNLFIDINMSYDVRYGIRTFSFLYNTPALVLNQITYSLLLFSAEKEITRNNKCSFYNTLVLIIMLSTLRFRSFGLVVVFIFFVFLVRKTKMKKIGSKFLFIGVVLLILGFSQIRHYFFSGILTPRSRFLLGAIALA